MDNIYGNLALIKMNAVVLFALLLTSPSPKIEPALPYQATSVSVLPAKSWQEVKSNPQASGSRITTSLNGSWELAAGNENPPVFYPSQVQVPGLVDLASPEVSQTAPYYWYRKSFQLSEFTPSAKLKIRKAMYGTKIILNGQSLGEFFNCFTPIELDISSVLNRWGKENILMIRVGRMENLPETAWTGSDYEKIVYTPGIYDDVEVIQSGRPTIAWTQIRPMPADQKVGVLTYIRHTLQENIETPVTLSIKDPDSGETIASHSVSVVVMPKHGHTLYLELPAPNLENWSPENPKLYTMTVQTSGDEEVTTFGQRSFTFDPATKASTLNGKPYPWRGTNIAIHRFFEDADRADLPWNEDWVREVIRKFKSMGWNACRYTIGFPPEIWYRIANEEGLLIQDEFPIWRIFDFPEQFPVQNLIEEYAQWMVDRWNHPSVVLWDAANETPGTWQTGFAASQVRGYDLSERPWEGGASEIFGDSNHPWESHAYIFLEKPDYDLIDLNERINTKPPIMVGLPYDIEPFVEGHPRFVNEFDWLWLNRDGTPTEFTRGLYDRLLGVGHTEQQRRFLKAVHTASMMELFRVNPHTALTGVLQFCALGYNRNQSGGVTSDNWLSDLNNLQLDPYFEKWVGDASQPISAMVPQWWAGGPDLTAGQNLVVPVWVKNDTEATWTGTVFLKLYKGSPSTGTGAWNLVRTSTVNTTAPGFGQIGRTSGLMRLPLEPGTYYLVAEMQQGSRIQESIRELKVAVPSPSSINGIRLGKPVKP